ncbi:hypothetical protein B0H65DRAFT_416744 [Neurospora tetraspora]|uniref:Uncharacterized protein n=1 Tax=Neurospora tetraspora TaxID=94610 RepID=A0AAE0JQ56_9PEZI|nr:hypothetical protein B0H65DRAFT_416744 [Neurospora tetraspora]
MAKSYQAPNNSWMDTWIPAIFGSAPGRLFEIPPKRKPLEHVYGLNTDSITEYTSINCDAGDDKSARFKTSNNNQTQPEPRRISWHSQTSETMIKLKVPRDSIPSAFTWKPPGEVAVTKNQNRKHMDKLSDHDTNDTILLTQIWEIQNTLQYTRKTGTQVTREKKNSHKVSLNTRRLDKLRAWNVTFEGRQRLRRKARSKTATRSLEEYLKKMGTPLKYNSGDTVQSKAQWPGRIAKIWKLFIYFVGFAIILASCVGISIVICKPLFLQGHSQRDSVFSDVTNYGETASDGKACLNNSPCLNNPQYLDTPQRLRKTRLGLGPGGGNHF